MPDQQAVEGRDSTAAVLRRLMRARASAAEDAGRAPLLPQPLRPTPARAAATALGRAAERLYGIAVQPLDMSPGALTLAELPELLPSPAMICVLQGPGDALGVIALCPALTTALIEAQAMGRITARPVERRRASRSDAALCADFIDRLLAELGTELQGQQGFEGFAGFRYASFVDDARPLALMLDDRPLRSLTMRARLTLGDTREGQVFLALPQPQLQSQPQRAGAPATAIAPPPPITVPDRASAGGGPARGAVSAASTLGPAMRDAPVEVLGVLCRRRITLGELRALMPGRLLALPRVTLADARIETAAGQMLARGRLGETDGCHAIRLCDPDHLAVAQHPVLDAPASLTPSAPGAPIEDLCEPDPFRDPPDAATAPSRIRGGEGLPA